MNVCLMHMQNRPNVEFVTFQWYPDCEGNVFG